MAWYWWVILIILTLMVFKRKLGRARPMSGQDESIVNPWFRENGIEPSSVSYSTYNDRNLLAESVDRIIVGFGYSNGEATGFYIEIGNDRIMDTGLLDTNAASYHASCAREAL